MNEPAQHYPGALSAVFITLGAVFAWGFVIAFFGPGADMGAIGIGQALGVGMVATLAARNVPAPQPERLGLCGFDLKFVPFLILLLPVALLVGEFDSLLSGLAPEMPALPEGGEDETSPLLSPRNAQLATLQSAIVVVGIAPVVEEFLFRGVLLQGTVATLGRVRGILLTAVLFSMLNVAPTGLVQSPAGILLSAIALGVVYGLARLATGSLLAPLALHAAVNAMGLYAASNAPPPGPEGFEVVQSTSITLIIPALIAVGIGMRGLWQATTEKDLTLPLPADKSAAWRRDDED